MRRSVRVLVSHPFASKKAKGWRMELFHGSTEPFHRSRNAGVRRPHPSHKNKNVARVGRPGACAVRVNALFFFEMAATGSQVCNPSGLTRRWRPGRRLPLPAPGSIPARRAAFA